MGSLKKNSGFFLYLQEKQLLDASPEVRAKARKQYHAIWKREWRAKHKDGRKYYKPYFTSKDNQAVCIAAKKHGMSPTKFIQESTLARLHDTRILPHSTQFRKMIQLLSIIRNDMDERGSLHAFTHEENEALISRLDYIENILKELYYNPPLLLEALRETCLLHPAFLSNIYQALSKLESDYKISKP